MEFEWRQSKREVPKGAKRYDSDGNERDDVVSEECKYDESGKEEEDGDEEEGRKRFD
jgi:hypothetical protein